MLNWLHPQKSNALEQAQARARERARQSEQEQVGGHGAPSQDGLVVEEISAEEFMRLFPQGDKVA
jgi:hypothetical protein